MAMLDCEASSTLTGLLAQTNATNNEIISLSSEQAELEFNHWQGLPAIATFRGEPTGGNQSRIPIYVVTTDRYLGPTQYLSHYVTIGHSQSACGVSDSKQPYFC